MFVFGNFASRYRRGARGVIAAFALVTLAASAEPAAGAPMCCRSGGTHSGSRLSSHSGSRVGGHLSSPSLSRSKAPRSTAPTSVAPRALRSHAASPTPRTRSRVLAPAKPRINGSRAAGSSPPGSRDSRGRLKRSAEAKEQFMWQTGHPHGWPGHVVDHIRPLACGGADAPSNMQWQTTAEAKAKDKVERSGCGRR